MTSSSLISGFQFGSANERQEEGSKETEHMCPDDGLQEPGSERTASGSPLLRASTWSDSSRRWFARWVELAGWKGSGKDATCLEAGVATPPSWSSRWSGLSVWAMGRPPVRVLNCPPGLQSAFLNSPA